MQPDFIKLNVPPEIATAFREATPEAQAKASEKAWEVLRYALMSRKDALREFERIADKMSATARERGLTEEKLEKLLGDDDTE